MSIESKLHHLCNETIHSAFDKGDWRRRRNALQSMLSDVKENQICDRFCGGSQHSTSTKALKVVGIAGITAAVVWFGWKWIKTVAKTSPDSADLKE
jgi:hypothetical protein